MISSAHPIALAVGQRLVSCLLEGSALAAAVSLLLWLTPKGNSRTRFAVWFLTLIGILVLPLMARSGDGASGVGGFLPHLKLPGAWATYGLIAWAALFCFGLARIVAGLWNLYFLRQRGRELQRTDLPEAAWQGLGGLAGSRRVQFCVSDEVKGPTAVGFFRPAVLLPPWAVKDLSAEEINRVLLHELGHLQRWDDWTNLLQKVLRVLLWFHPAVWWIDSQLSLERESACDDLVLAKAPDARAYAECLVSLAEKSCLRRRVALAVAAVGRMRQTAVRLSRILDTNRSRTNRLSKLVLASGSALGLLAVLAFPHLPNFVQFQNGSDAELAGAAVDAPDAEFRTAEPVNNASRRAATEVVIPAAMQIPETGEGRNHVRMQQTKLAVPAHKQHFVSPALVRASVAAREQRGVEPRLVLFVENTEFSAAAPGDWPVVQPWSNLVLEEGSGNQPAPRNGELRVLRLTIFADGLVLRQELIANVI